MKSNKLAYIERRRKVMRNRKIVKVLSILFSLIGFGCAFWFASTGIEHSLPWGVGIAGVIFCILGYLGMKLLDETRGN